MEKDRILNKIMELLREQPTVNTASAPGKPGLSSKADKKGPMAGLDKPLGRKKTYLTLGRGGRKRWMKQK